MGARSCSGAEDAALTAGGCSLQVIVVGLHIVVLLATVFLLAEFTLKFTDVRPSPAFYLGDLCSPDSSHAQMPSFPEG